MGVVKAMKAMTGMKSDEGHEDRGPGKATSQATATATAKKQQATANIHMVKNWQT